MKGAANKTKTAATAKAGALVDRGYQPYTGTHTPVHTRWRVIARRALGMTTRQPWVIVMLVLAAFCTLAFAAAMWIASKIAGAAPPGAVVPSPDPMILQLAVKWYGTLPLAFLMALFAGGGAVADDARTGAFQFYFARPITREQYLAGKLVAAVTLTAMVTLAPSLLLALLRLTMTTSAGELVRRLPLLAAATGLGAIAALALAAPALALSSLAKGRGLAQAAFAALVLLPWLVGSIFARVTRSPWPELLSLPAHLANLGRWLHRVPLGDDERALPVWLSLAFVAALVAASLALLRRRLAAVEVVAS
jgi:ABC-type transport system involved in multi-copper enzyme maturation permease subunit